MPSEIKLEKIGATTRQKIHASELAHEGQGKDEVIERLLEILEEYPELGEVDQNTGWFEVSPAIYVRNRNQIRRQKMKSNGIVSLLIIFGGFFFALVFENPFWENLSLVVTLAGITYFISVFFQFIGSREQTDEELGEGALSLIGGIGM